MTDTPSKTKTTRRPDCVTEIRMGSLRGKYITAVPGEDTKTVKSAGA